jgi:hypothetical protein
MNTTRGSADWRLRVRVDTYLYPNKDFVPRSAMACMLASFAMTSLDLSCEPYNSPTMPHWKGKIDPRKIFHRKRGRMRPVNLPFAFSNEAS